jgi:hypothetical protein
MKSCIQTVLLACLSLSLLSALPVSAETFTVHLVDGGSILSRYQPQRAAWDAKTILVLSETGNWIGVKESQVKEISSSLDKRGFGLRIDAKTIFLGWSANDLDPNAPQSAEEDAPSRSVDQFVEPGQSGKVGVPASYIIETTGGSGGGGGGTGLPPATPIPASPPPVGTPVQPPAGSQ